MTEPVHTIALPAPALTGDLSVEAALVKRRSVRRYAAGGLELALLGQLLWAAQGVTDAARGFRTAPSAGARFPLGLAVVARDVHGLGPGFYAYVPESHAVTSRFAGHVAEELSAAAVQDPSVRGAPATLVFTAPTGRSTTGFGERGLRDVMLDVGHAAQNVYLQATAIGLGVVAVGAFDETAVKRVLRLEGTEEPLYLMPVGHATESV